MREKKPDRIQVYMERDIFMSTLLVYLTKETPEGTFIGKINWEKTTKFVKPEGATLEVSDEGFSDSRPSLFVKSLMQSLKNVGLFQKQPEAKMLEGELKAKCCHLEDMRKLVFETQVIEEKVQQ